MIDLGSLGNVLTGTGLILTHTLAYAQGKRRDTRDRVAALEARQDSLMMEHKDLLDKMAAEREARLLAEATRQHLAEQLDDLKRQHADELADLKQQHADEVAQLRARIEQLEQRQGPSASTPARQDSEQGR